MLVILDLFMELLANFFYDDLAMLAMLAMMMMVTIALLGKRAVYGIFG